MEIPEVSQMTHLEQLLGGSVLIKDSEEKYKYLSNLSNLNHKLLK